MNMETHEDIRMTLPWFANGTLDERELSAVNEHLESCEECRLEVEQLIAVSQRFNEPTFDDERWQQIAANSKHALIDQLLLERKSTESPRTRLPRLKAWKTWTDPRYLALAASVVLVIGIVLTPLINRESEPGIYLPQSGTPDSTTVATGGTVVQLVFRPDTSDQLIDELFSGDTLTLLGVPSEKGVYRVQLSPEMNVMRQLDQLRGHPYVIFAQLENP